MPLIQKFSVWPVKAVFAILSSYGIWPGIFRELTFAEATQAPETKVLSVARVSQFIAILSGCDIWLKMFSYLTFAEASQAPDTKVLMSGANDKLITSPVWPV